MKIKPNISDTIYFERSVFNQFLEYTRRFSKYEWGGLLIGTEIDYEIHCVAAIISPQKTQSMGYCEINKELFVAIYNCFEKIEEEFSKNELKITTWIHTHPNLGTFLSEKDIDTYNYLIKLNSTWYAIVVDPVSCDFLAVNSKPGNLYGFTEVELNLEYFYNFENSNQNLIAKLKLIKKSINSEMNKKLLKLNDIKSIEAFIPIPIKY